MAKVDKEYVKELESDLKRAQAALRLVYSTDPTQYGYFSPSRKFGRGAAKAVRRMQDIAVRCYYEQEHLFDGISK